MFYLTTHSTHFIYGYMVSDIWLRTILIVRKDTCCCNIGYSFWLAARVLLYAPSHRQDSTYHGLCYTSRRALAWTRNSSMGPPHEGSIWWPIAQWTNALTTELHLTPKQQPRRPTTITRRAKATRREGAKHPKRMDTKNWTSIALHTSSEQKASRDLKISSFFQ